MLSTTGKQGKRITIAIFAVLPGPQNACCGLALVFSVVLLCPCQEPLNVMKDKLAL